MYALLLSSLLLGADVQFDLAFDSGGKFRVLVEAPSDKAKEAGVDKASIQTQVEAALRRCGVPLAPESTATTFYVNVNADVLRVGYVANVEVQVYRFENVRGRQALVELWSKGSLLTGPRGDLAPNIREGLAIWLDDFCNQYLKAREAGGGSPKN